MYDSKDRIVPLGEEIRSGGVSSVLASLYRNIQNGIGIDMGRFNQLLERYIIKSNIPTNIKEISSLRGNIKKELMKSSMTWKIFVKGLVFLNVRKFELTIKLHHANGNITEHKTIPIILDDYDVED